MSTEARSDVLAVLRSLSPQERYEYGIGPAPASRTSDTPKLQPLLDQVAEADIGKVVNACRAGIKAVAEGGADSESVTALRAVSPRLADTCVENSAYRRKSLVHSVRTCAEYLQSPEAAAKRAAARLRVPPAAAAAPTAPAGGGK